jgi:hypothetical protein
MTAIVTVIVAATTALAVAVLVFGTATLERRPDRKAL